MSSNYGANKGKKYKIVKVVCFFCGKDRQKSSCQVVKWGTARFIMCMFCDKKNDFFDRKIQ